jgi:hypothetical protein
MPPIAPCYFLPAALPAGIEPADPMITARNEAYPSPMPAVTEMGLNKRTVKQLQKRKLRNN